MKSKKILNTETEPLTVASLPARPNQSVAFGGKSYSSAELRAAFDRLPLLLVERYNDLISDIESGDICDAIPTGLLYKHTLKELMSDVKNGKLATYLTVNDTSLFTLVMDFEQRLQRIEEALFG